MPVSNNVPFNDDESEVDEPINQNVEKKRTRKMTPEMLEKLKVAREKALEMKRKAKGVNEELVQIRSELKKEKLGDRVNEVETYHKIKEKVESEVKANEIVNINKKLEDMYSKFDGFLQDREKRKVEKAQRKQEKQTKDIVRELPNELARRMIDEQLREHQIKAFRAKMFGL
jgi:hypothetical protein